MEVLWMGLSIFGVILTSFILVMGLAKGVTRMSRNSAKGSFRSKWLPIQIYSGDDVLDHPDLKRLSEIQTEQV